MIQKLVRYILEKAGIDYDKLRFILANIEVYENHNGEQHMHISSKTSFQAELKAPNFISNVQANKDNVEV